MSTYSHPYDFDEIPIRNKHGVIVGYGYYEGYADLVVTEESGSPELERVGAVYLEASGEGCEGKLIKLHKSDPVFISIEFEIKRLAEDGKIEFELPEDFEDDYEFQRKEYRAAQGY